MITYDALHELFRYENGKLYDSKDECADAVAKAREFLHGEFARQEVA